MIMKVNCISQFMSIVYPSHTQLNAQQGAETSVQQVFDSIVISIVRKETNMTLYWF